MTTDFWTAVQSAFEHPGEEWICSGSPQRLSMSVENDQLRFRLGDAKYPSSVIEKVDTKQQWTRVDPPAPTLVFEPDGSPRYECNGADYHLSGTRLVPCPCGSHTRPVQHYILRKGDE